MTSLTNQQLGLEWRNGNTLIAYCQDQTALRKILSEGLFQAFSLYSKDTPLQNVSIMMADLMDTYKYEDVGLILSVIKDIRAGKRKIYGLVTPNDVNELLTAKLDELAQAREQKHYENKGFAEIAIENRTSGRISDFAPKK